MAELRVPICARMKNGRLVGAPCKPNGATDSAGGLDARAQELYDLERNRMAQRGTMERMPTINWLPAPLPMPKPSTPAKPATNQTISTAITPEKHQQAQAKTIQANTSSGMIGLGLLVLGFIAWRATT